MTYILEEVRSCVSVFLRSHVRKIKFRRECSHMKEFAALGFDAQWLTVTGKMVGVAALFSEISGKSVLHHLKSHEPVTELSEVERERVFIFACRRGRSIFQAGSSGKGRFAGLPIHACAWQALLRVQGPEEMRAAAKLAWNERGKPPLHTWLKESHSADDLHRLRTIGNIVIPRSAQCAMHMAAASGLM